MIKALFSRSEAGGPPLQSTCGALGQGAIVVQAEPPADARIIGAPAPASRGRPTERIGPAARRRGPSAGEWHVKIATTVVRSGALSVGGDADLLLIAGPCVIESWETLCAAADGLRAAADGLPFTLVFKASYDKANRSSPDSYRGPGLARGLEMLARLRERTGLPITSDVHTPDEAARARDVLDIIQIPALLCRQNDLIAAAAQSGRIVNVKKGQFLSPGEMPNRVLAARGPGGVARAIATERGTFFGYHNLVNDFKGVASIRAAGIPTIFDATHSVQLPGGRGTTSGGEREYAPALARAAAAAGIDGFFFEVHPDPENARCDGPNCMGLGGLRKLLEELAGIDALVRGRLEDRR